MIAFDHVAIRFDRFTLENISFTVPTGVYAVLMGRTGCGKTTLLEAACGLRRLDAGRIFLNHQDVTRLPPGRRGIGLVPQDAALFNTMTVAENLGFALSVRHRPQREIDARVAELAEWLGIDPLLPRHPPGLSGGERQRVAVGRALAARPAVLCLDEPFSALDAETHADMVRLLRKIHQDLGVTVLHITHNLQEARLLAQRQLILRDGCIQEAIKIIADIGQPLYNQMLNYDLRNPRFRLLPLTRNPDCPDCARSALPPTHTHIHKPSLLS